MNDTVKSVTTEDSRVAPNFIIRAYRWLRFYRLHGMSPSEVAKHRTTIHDNDPEVNR